MHKYLYILNAEKPFTDMELGSIKDELCRLFKCSEISVAGGTQFTIHSPLDPRQIDSVVKEFSMKFRVQFAAGGTID